MKNICTYGRIWWSDFWFSRRNSAEQRSRACHKTTIADILLKGYQRDRIEVVANGSEFQTFVRLRYPTSELRKALAAEISKSNIMAAKVRKTKAFEELEKEIEVARNSK